MAAKRVRLVVKADETRGGSWDVQTVMHFESAGSADGGRVDYSEVMSQERFIEVMKSLGVG
ncbi:hypothetical protein [Agromyces sp. GXS1127]|uniref:hypothetical protein n=1 Tax=Agromyces sp. GXS1127 TaxID=3424181 RepID=UPI003D31C14F